jgi:hypothetical protein
LSFRRFKDLPLFRNFYIVYLTSKHLTESETLFITMAVETNSQGVFRNDTKL